LKGSASATKQAAVLKGHEFTRAESAMKSMGALALEGSFSIGSED
jgi:hypothetical protein